ncbi:MAG: hypothetical protein ABF812_12685 [Gluconobacter cerinus]|uniref:hypothetical protein n=1 Tax=Gluconobacter cerinus TaxID=38307 RepID=UPI0039EC778E
MTFIIPKKGKNAFPGWNQNYIPSPGEWDAWWSNKADDYSITVTADQLKGAGAPMTGLDGADDAPYVQAAIDAAVATATAAGVSANICFEFGNAHLWFGSAINSRSAAIYLNGGGIDCCIIRSGPNAGGLWIHGTTSSLSDRPFGARGITFHDLNVSSGYVGLSGTWSAGSIPTFRLAQVKFLYFSQAMYLYNPPRDINVSDLTVWGEDYAMQADPGIVIESTQSGPEVFTTSWIMCNVFNYAWGWRYIGGGMIEGHRFYGSTCYNGWGMVQAYVHGDGIVGLTGYQAVIWDFYCCDWQGFGYALDMRNCRGVRVRGGFFTFNDRTSASGKTIAPPWGARTSAATNAMFDFSNCADVQFDGVQIDTSGSGTYDDTVIAHFDNGCTHVIVKDNAIFASSKLYGGFELGDTIATSMPTNTLKVLENEWLNWVGGDKVIDHGSKQIDLPWLTDNWLGTETALGLITIQQQVIVTIQSATVSSTDTTEIGQAFVSFPTNRYGNNLFKGGVPTIAMSVQQALTQSQSPFYLGASANNGFYINTDKNMIGVQVTVNYIATGW